MKTGARALLRRRLGRGLGVAVTFALVWGMMSAPAASAAASPAPSMVVSVAGTHLTSFDAQMITLINRARASAGLAGVREARGLDQLALWWSGQLNAGATSYKLAHNPNAWTDVLRYGAANRSAWGENVAWSSSTGTTAQQLFTAYMNSPGHRANILSKSFHYVGMGTVAGAHGLFNTTEFTDAVQAGQAVTSAPVNGDFVKDASTAVVYRLAGGSPIFVSTWVAFGGIKPVKVISHAQLLALPQYPANGTFLYTANDRHVYEVVGGAPVMVSAWPNVGGVHPTVQVDPAAVARAGQSGNWAHLRAVPADGTFIKTSGNAVVYRIAGGAPIFVTSWTSFGRAQPTVGIDASAVLHAGQSGIWAHIRMYPANGTYIKGAGAAMIDRVAAGVPKPFAAASSAAGKAVSYVIVDPLAISRAGAGGYYNHLKK